MANRKKNTGKKKKNKVPFWADERKKKILGLGFVLLSMFLAVAFISYIFTWKTDQDAVMDLSLGFFSESVAVENYLGKLGAYLSHAVIYFGFGVGSFLFIPILADLGWQLFHRKSLKPFLGRLFNGLFVIAGISILAAFIFQHSTFSWGGAVGESVCHWLRHFIGQIGLLLLLVTLTISYFIWLFNFNIREFSFSSLKNSINWKINWEPVKKSIHNFLEEGGDEKANPINTQAAVGQQQALDFQFDEPQEYVKPNPPEEEEPIVTLRPSEIVEKEKKIQSFEKVDSKSYHKSAKENAPDELEIVDTHTHAPVTKLSVQEEEKNK